MQGPPFSHELDCLTDCSFLAAAFTSAAGALGCFFGIVAEEEEGGVEDRPIDSVGAIFKSEEGIGGGVVDLKSLGVLGAMLGQDGGEIDRLRVEIELDLEDGGLMGVHAFKDYCFG
jgi:hypothetical protein